MAPPLRQGDVDSRESGNDRGAMNDALLTYPLPLMHYQSRFADTS